MAAADEVRVDLAFCVGEREGRGGRACSVDDGGGFGLEAVDVGRGDWVSDVEEVGYRGVWIMCVASGGPCQGPGRRTGYLRSCLGLRRRRGWGCSSLVGNGDLL